MASDGAQRRRIAELEAIVARLGEELQDADRRLVEAAAARHAVLNLLVAIAGTAELQASARVPESGAIRVMADAALWELRGLPARTGEGPTAPPQTRRTTPSGPGSG